MGVLPCRQEPQIPLDDSLREESEVVVSDASCSVEVGSVLGCFSNSELFPFALLLDFTLEALAREVTSGENAAFRGDCGCVAGNVGSSCAATLGLLLSSAALARAELPESIVEPTLGLASVGVNDGAVALSSFWGT